MICTADDIHRSVIEVTASSWSLACANGGERKVRVAEMCRRAMITPWCVSQ